jgi:hypothetical protein
MLLLALFCRAVRDNDIVRSALINCGEQVFVLSNQNHSVYC